MSQLDMFGGLKPKPKPRDPDADLLEEEKFYRALHEGQPSTRRYLCPWCQRSYISISYHFLRLCTGNWESPPPKPDAEGASESSGRVEGEKTETSPLSQEETQQPERSENMPGEYAWLKKKGVEKGDVMRPDLKRRDK